MTVVKNGLEEINK